jgi:hypothetical protein
MNGQAKKKTTSKAFTATSVAEKRKSNKNSQMKNDKTHKIDRRVARLSKDGPRHFGLRAETKMLHPIVH